MVVLNLRLGLCICDSCLLSWWLVLVMVLLCGRLDCVIVLVCVFSVLVLKLYLVICISEMLSVMVRISFVSIVSCWISV